MKITIHLTVDELDWTTATIDHTVTLVCDHESGISPHARADHITGHYSAAGGALAQAMHVFLVNQPAEALERGVAMGDDPDAVRTYRRAFEMANHLIGLHTHPDDPVQSDAFDGLVAAIDSLLQKPVKKTKKKRKK